MFDISFYQIVRVLRPSKYYKDKKKTEGQQWQWQRFHSLLGNLLLLHFVYIFEFIVFLFSCLFPVTYRHFTFSLLSLKRFVLETFCSTVLVCFTVCLSVWFRFVWCLIAQIKLSVTWQITIFTLLYFPKYCNIIIGPRNNLYSFSILPPSRLFAIFRLQKKNTQRE